MSKTTGTTVLTVELPSFDELIARLGDEKKMAEAKRATLKIKKEAKLSSLVKTAKIAVIESEDKLADVLLSDNGDEAFAIKMVIDAKKTLEFYEAIYNALFPNV